MKHEGVTEKIIGAFYTVYNELGYGFLEKVYENALVIELRRAELRVEQQLSIQVSYKQEVVGVYFADIVVEEAVVLELKAARNILKEHEAQLLNYLKATPFEVGLLLNFGPTPKHIRKIYDNDLKQNLLK
jgi:GxxExxY protein